MVKVCIVAAAIALAACSSTSSVPLVSQGQTAPSQAVSPDKGCVGSGGVKAEPCHVKLDDKNGGQVIVTISGPGVNHSFVEEETCNDFCNITAINSPIVTQWQVTSGDECGDATATFLAYDPSDQQVGSVRIQIKNKDC